MSEGKRRADLFAVRLVSVQPDLYRLVASLLPFSPEDVDDVVQNANLDLLAKQESYSPERPFLPFALSFAKTAVRTYILKKSRSRLVFSEEAMASAADLIAEESAISPDNLSTLKRLEICKTHLSERQKKLLDDRYGKKRPVQTIADELGKSNEAVRSALVYIRQRLAECMRSLCRMPDDVFERKFPDAFTDRISQVIDNGETVDQAEFSEGIWESAENLRTVVDQVGVDALLRRYSPTATNSGVAGGSRAVERSPRRGGRLRRVAAAAGLLLLLSTLAYAATVAVAGLLKEPEAPTARTASAETMADVPAGGSPLHAVAGSAATSTKTLEIKEGPMRRKSIRLILNAWTAALAAAFPEAATAADPYVGSEAANIIYTDYYANPRTRIELDFQYTTGGGMIISPWVRGSGLATALWNAGSSNGGLQFLVGDTTGGTDGKKVDSGHTLSVNRRFLSIDCSTGKLRIAMHNAATTNEVEAGASFTQTANWPVCLLGSTKSTDGTSIEPTHLSRARIFGCKIYEKEAANGEYVLVRNYVPVLRDGVPCLHDTVTDRFALDPRAGAAPLNYGGDIEEVGHGYIQMVSAAGSNLGLNTGYHMNMKSRVELDYAFGSIIVQRPMGCWNGASTLRNLVWTESNRIKFFLNNEKVDTGLLIDTDRHTLVFDMPAFQGRYYFDGGSVLLSAKDGAARPSAGTVASNPLGVFADTGNAAGTTFVQPAPFMKCYGLKIYEDDILVTNFVPFVKNGCPGLKDTVTGAFVASEAWRNEFYAGGQVATEGHAPLTAADAYVESDGTQVLNAGYHVTSRSRIEVDMRLVSTSGDVIFFGNYDNGNSLRWCMWRDKGIAKSVLSGSNKADAISNGLDLSLRRYVAVLDIKNGTGYFRLPDGSENGKVTFTSTTMASVGENETSLFPLGIFGSLKNAAGDSITMPSKMRVYSVRIYEGDATEPAAEFLPYKGPEGVGLYDTKTGAVALKHSASVADPSIGGRGVDGAERWLKMPASLSIKKSDGTKTLSAAAVGAVAYRWTRNGTAIADETGGNLDVVWRKSRTPDVYTVTPVYSVFGAELEGEPLSVEVVNEPLGTTIVFR